MLNLADVANTTPTGGAAIDQVIGLPIAAAIVTAGFLFIT